MGGVPGWAFCSQRFESSQRPVVYVHGGGLTGGDAGCFQGICSRLARETGQSVLVPHYRLCPEATKLSFAQGAGVCVQTLT